MTDQQPNQPAFPEFPDASVTPIPPEAPAQQSSGEVKKSESSYAEPEAPVVLYTTIWTPGGQWMNLTLRGANPVVVLESMMDTLKYAESVHGIKGVKPDMMMIPTGAAPVPPTINPPSVPQAFPPKTPEQAAAAPVPPQPRDDSKGTGKLNQMIIKADPTSRNGLVFEFYVGEFKWAFKDSRTVKTITKLFDPALNFTEDMLSKPMVYIPNPDLQVDWEKNGKYYNVVRVHR